MAWGCGFVVGGRGDQYWGCGLWWGVGWGGGGGVSGLGVWVCGGGVVGGSDLGVWFCGAGWGEGGGRELRLIG